MNQAATITVVGSNNMDLITYMDRMPREGETIFGRDFELGFGGKGANQAVASAKLGGNVFMVSKVGEDLFGPEIIKNLKKIGVDVGSIQSIPDATSGVASIFVDQEGNNRILVVKGANDCVNRDDVDRARERIKRSDFLVMQLEIPVETVYYAIQVAHEVGTLVILNPAPATQLDFDALKNVFLFAPNEKETGTLCGDQIASIEDAKSCGKEFVDKGIQNVVVTLGERGSLLINSAGAEHIPARKVSTVDTTGAGDAFIGSLAVFLAEGQTLLEAIEDANHYAALSTLSRGTQKSFLNRNKFKKMY